MHFYELQDELEDQLERDKISFTFQSFGRYQDKSENLKNKNRLQIKNNTFDLKIIQEYNSTTGNSEMPLGASLFIKTTKTDELIMGTYQIRQGYGLLQNSRSFISEKPNFTSNFSENRPAITANARPYFSHSFFGVAYKKSLSNTLNVYAFGSHKDVGAKISDGKVTTLDLAEPNPDNTIIQSMGGSILSFQKNNLNISGMVNYFYTEIPYQEKPITSSLAFSFLLKNYMFFGESAYINETFAHLYGVKNSFQRFTQILSYRRIDENYHSEYANFMSNSSNQTNEEGLFYKIEYRNSGFFMQTFADVFDNIKNQERYINKNIGSNVGLKIEQKIEDMIFGVSMRQKKDKEWRNLSGITRYENRKRDYLKLAWTQLNISTFTTKLTFDFQQREYPDYDLINDGYALSQSINMSFSSYAFAFILGTFETEIPLYLYLYNGRLNNPLIVLSDEGQYVMFYGRNTISKMWEIELMSYYLNKEKPEYTFSAMVMCRF